MDFLPERIKGSLCKCLTQVIKYVEGSCKKYIVQ